MSFQQEFHNIRNILTFSVLREEERNNKTQKEKYGTKRCFLILGRSPLKNRHE
jgi:hypothetical protein